MLALTRKPDERIFIEVSDEVIELVVVRIDRNTVRIGFIADKEKVRIYRQEVYTNVLRERLNSRKGESDAEDADSPQQARIKPEIIQHPTGA